MRELMLSGLGIVVVIAFGLAGADALADECCEVFVETYGGSLDEVANCVISTQDGGFVVTGYLGGGGTGGKSVLLAKFDSQGNLLWRQAYGGPEEEEGRCVVETHDGKLVMVGYTRSYTAGGADFLLSKFDAEGNRLWMRTWGDDGDEKAYGVFEASDHTLWVTGYSTSFNLGGHKEVVLARIAADGDVLTGGYAGNPALSWDYWGRAVAEVFDTAGFCVTGGVTGPLVDQDILLIKFSHNAEPLWAKRFRNADSIDSSEEGTSIVRTSDACLALAGPVTYWDGVYVSEGGFLLKTDIDAEPDWGRFAHGLGPYYSKALTSVIETDSGLVVTGRDHGGVMYDDRVVLAKWGLAGEQLRSAAHEFGDGCVGSSVTEDADNCLLVAGLTSGYGMGGDDFLLAKYYPTGLTCLPNVGGPSFSEWLPEEHGLSPSSGEFTESTSDWDHPVFPYYMTVTPICPTTYTVCPDGSGDFETIQEAIDAAYDGDTIELCDATFSDTGNVNLDFQGKAITVKSQSGNPEACIIDCGPGIGVVRRGFYFHSDEGPCSVVDGVKIINGYCNIIPPGSGGAILCDGSSPTIQNCVMAGNSTGYGGGIACIGDSSPTITGCVISGNRAVNGGGIYCDDAWAKFASCTISGNCADTGGGIWHSGLAYPYLEYTILWGNAATDVGDEWYAEGITFYCCCDVNTAGIYHGKTAAPVCPPNMPNIDEDPLFCDPDPEPCENAPTTEGNYCLRPGSPCIDNDPCGQIGALGYGSCIWDVSDGNCFVDPFDANFVAARYGCPVGQGDPDCDRADIDGNGVVDPFDYNAVMAHYGPCPCP